MSTTARSQNTTSRAEIRIRKAEDVRHDEEAPRSERHDLEDADDVVDRGVIGSLLVSVVQPVDAGEQTQSGRVATKSAISQTGATRSAAEQEARARARRRRRPRAR